jgi:hypothetical protein
MPMRQCGDDEREAERLSALLREGDAADGIAAREGLAGLYERRGEFDRAAEQLIMNARAGAGGALTFLWLARLYRAQGDARLAARAAAEAAKYLPPKIKERRPVSVLGRLLRSARDARGRVPTPMISRHEPDFSAGHVEDVRPSVRLSTPRQGGSRPARWRLNPHGRA